MAIISIDFFGNLNERAIFWKELLKFTKLEGTKVSIISGLWPTELSEKLEFSGFIRNVHYDDVYSILSHLSSKGLDTWFDENQDSWYSDKNNWWKAKAEICQQMNCQTHFDSDHRFAKSFEDIATRFIHTFDPDNKKLIDLWHRDLVMANTYDDHWENDYMSLMSGIVPM